VPILASIDSILQGIVSTTRLAPLVRERLPFVLHQIRRRNDVGSYHLRESGVAIVLRHGTPDMNTLEEIFRMGHYEIPKPVTELLAAIDRPLQVVDLGANVGLFGAYVLGRYPDARIVAFEPHPANAALLRRVIEANGPGDRWELVEAAAAASDGSVEFSGDFNTGRVGEGGFSVPAVAIFPYLAGVDLAKIDIEGAEWELFADERSTSLSSRVVALEHHPYLCPGDSPKQKAHEFLGRAGYETVDQKLHGPPGHGMVWGWKSE
jgi:FkbM family methyltransferase